MRSPGRGPARTFGGRILDGDRNGGRISKDAFNQAMCSVFQLYRMVTPPQTGKASTKSVVYSPLSGGGHTYLVFGGPSPNNST